MSTVDWVILAFTVLLALYGYSRGFVVGVLSLGGFAAGAYLGAHLGPLVLPQGSHSPYAPLFGLLGALLAGGVLATGLEGLGMQARRVMRLPGLRLIDGLLGAALTACVALGVAWIVGAVALESAGSAPLRMDLQRSTILRALNQVLPPSGPILGALAHFDPLPSLRGPAASVAPPPRGGVGSPGIRAAAASVVRVDGTACGLGIEGSGWVAARGVVVTNAHVVAGEHDTSVQVGGHSPDRPAQLIGFDPHDDIAILRIADLALPVLRLAPDTRAGVSGAILGYPLDGPFDAESARLGETADVSADDAYGNGPVSRRITALRGRIRPGNSGGPMVDRAGRVLGTVFASITGGAPGAGPAGYAVPNTLVAHQLGAALARGRTVSSGACAG